MQCSRNQASKSRRDKRVQSLLLITYLMMAGPLLPPTAVVAAAAAGACCCCPAARTEEGDGDPPPSTSSTLREGGIRCGMAKVDDRAGSKRIPSALNQGLPSLIRTLSTSMSTMRFSLKFWWFHFSLQSVVDFCSIASRLFSSSTS